MVNIRIIGGAKGCALAGELAAVAIVVDALRASATIATLLDRRAAEVIAVSEVSDARSLAETTPNALLAGERRGVKLSGFDLGNSPLEVLQSSVAGKTIVFTTTTGSRRLVEAAGATAILVGSPLNAGAAAEFAGDLARKKGRDIVLIPAGLAHDPSHYGAEDWYGAAFIARRIAGTVVPACREEFVALTERIEARGLAALFRQCDHGRLLADLGFEQDVGYCATPDLSAAVPIVATSLRLPSGALGARVIPSEQLPGRT